MIEPCIWTHSKEFTRMGFDPGSLQSILLSCIFTHEREWFLRNCSYIRRNPSPTPCPGGGVTLCFSWDGLLQWCSQHDRKGTLRVLLERDFPPCFLICFHLKTKDGVDMINDHCTISSCLMHIAKKNTPTLDMIGLVSFAKKKGWSYDHRRPGLQWLSHRGSQLFLFVQGNPESNRIVFDWSRSAICNWVRNMHWRVAMSSHSRWVCTGDMQDFETLKKCREEVRLQQKHILIKANPRLPSRKQPAPFQWRRKRDVLLAR